MNVSGLCKCGCGQTTGKAAQNNTKHGYIKGQHVDYVRGHSYRFNGGVAKHSKGYTLIKNPSHHRADTRGYVFEHILVIEEVLGRQLTGNECVHHKDENKNNNAPYNLQLCRDNAEHRRIHQELTALKECGNPSWRKCGICGEYDDQTNLYINPKTGKGARHRECFKKMYADNREHFNQLQRTRRHRKCPPQNG